MDLGTLANWATVLSGIAWPAIGTAVVMLRKYIKSEIRPHLTNNHTSAAEYAHQARDTAEQALQLATTTDAKVSRLETKVDGLILLQERNRGTSASGS